MLRKFPALIENAHADYTSYTPCEWIGRHRQQIAALLRACLTRLGFGAQEARGLPTVSRLPGHDRSMRASPVALA